MGYLLCGPVGTGKTFLVECLAGEAGVPVVKLKNFRDRWVGSSEGNLEKIFRLVRALGRCMVFIDEADQTLGRRESGSGDSGLSGRLYSMIAQEMADTANRGRVRVDPRLVAARPDRGRPEAPGPRRREGAAAADEHARPRARARRRAREALRPRARRDADSQALEPRMPTLLTPGAAEALVVKAYRHSRTESVERRRPRSRRASTGYQNPVPADVLEFQMRIAIREATDLAFVPPAFRKYAAQPAARHERQALLPRRRLQRAPVRHADAAELVRRRRVRACSARSSIRASG